MKMPAPANGRVHLDFIEGMRAAAALMVICNHVYAQIWLPNANHFPPWPLGFFTYSLVTGHLAVSVFICISGFCLMLPVVRNGGILARGALDFFKRRARRILPPYYVALLGSLLLIATIIGKPTGTLWDVCIQIRRIDVISHVLLLQHFFGTGRINYAFWSISLEWQIYFFFPLFVLSFRKLGATVTTAVLLAIGYAITLSFGPEFARIHRANLHYLGLFVVGMSAARIAFGQDEALPRLRARFPWSIAAACLALIQVALLAHWGWNKSTEYWPLLDLLSALTAACLLIAAARESGVVRRVFSVPPLVWIGRSSYSLYLIHAPLIQLFWQFVIAPLGLTGTPAFALLLFGGGPLMLLAANGFYRCFEEPFTSARVAATRSQASL
jgi:peptidoglycan/LPS O-acetylase OafA/YrhL